MAGSSDWDIDEAYNNALPAALRLSPEVMLRKRSLKAFTDRWHLSIRKQGKNDIDVEVYRDGNWEVANLTHVREGEFFQTLNDDNEVKACFICRQPARNVGGDDKNNPSLMLGVVEITTAAPKPLPKMITQQSNHREVIAKEPAKNDIEDVEIIRETINQPIKETKLLKDESND